MSYKLLCALGALVFSLAASAASAEIQRLPGGFMQRDSVLCSSTGRVRSLNSDAEITVISVNTSGDITFRQSGKRMTAKGVCGSTATVSTKLGSVPSRPRVAPAPAGAVFTNQPEQIVVPEGTFESIKPLPPTSQGDCFAAAFADGMSFQGAHEGEFIYCPFDKHGRPVYTPGGRRALHVTHATTKVDDNAWAGVVQSAAGGAVGSIGAALVHANSNGGGGGAASQSIGQAAANVSINLNGYAGK